MCKCAVCLVCVLGWRVTSGLSFFSFLLLSTASMLCNGKKMMPKFSFLVRVVEDVCVLFHNHHT